MNRIGNRYDLKHKISEGSFGQVYLGTDIRTGVQVAVKLELLTSKSKQLVHEADVYKSLASVDGVPSLLWHGVSGEYNAIVMDLLGPDLDELFDHCNRQFTDKTILQFGDRVITLLEQIHRCGYIYRDMKPQNFLIGLGTNGTSDIYLLDFGLSKSIQNVKNRKGRGLVGTARYASINAHRGDPPSYRDDMESLGYILIYFCRGALPWSGLKAKTTKEKYAKIANKKMEVSLKDLCKGYDQGYAQFIQVCRSVRAGDPVDYNKLRNILKGIAKRKNIQYDGIYDWCEPQFDEKGEEKLLPDPQLGTLRVKSGKSKKRKEKKEKEKERERQERALKKRDSMKSGNSSSNRRRPGGIRRSKTISNIGKDHIAKGDLQEFSRRLNERNIKGTNSKIKMSNYKSNNDSNGNNNNNNNTKKQQDMSSSSREHKVDSSGKVIVSEKHNSALCTIL